MSEILAAVGALCTSREALPDDLCTAWSVRDRWWVMAGEYVVTSAWRSGADEVAAHVALVASPHVVQALEHLLEAIAAVPRNELDDEVYRTADALSHVITRGVA